MTPNPAPEGDELVKRLRIPHPTLFHRRRVETMRPNERRTDHLGAHPMSGTTEKALIDREYWGSYRICIACMDQWFDEWRGGRS